jgi:hypothetical protein
VIHTKWGKTIFFCDWLEYSKLERERSTLDIDSSKHNEKFICVTKLSDQAKHYKEMVDIMKKMVKLDVELIMGERHLLSIG